MTNNHIMTTSALSLIAATLCALQDCTSGATGIVGEPCTNEPTTATFQITSRMSMVAALQCNHNNKWKIATCAVNGGEPWEAELIMAQVKTVEGVNIVCHADGPPTIAKKYGPDSLITRSCDKGAKSFTEKPMDGLEVKIMVECQDEGIMRGWWVTKCQMNADAPFNAGETKSLKFRSAGKDVTVTLKCHKTRVPTYA